MRPAAHSVSHGRYDSHTDAVSGPVGLGWLRPTVLLPTGSDAWPADRLKAVLLHEVAHVRRAD